MDIGIIMCFVAGVAIVPLLAIFGSKIIDNVDSFKDTMILGGVIVLLMCSSFFLGNMAGHERGKRDGVILAVKILSQDKDLLEKVKEIKEIPEK